jgi:hypothetical protein
MAITKKTSPLIGKQFRSVIADASCLFEVRAPQGRGAFKCVVINEPWEYEGKMHDSDCAGETRIFSTKEIETNLRMAEFWAKKKAQHEDFYGGLEVGQIIHYHHGFKEFIRCEVVISTKESRSNFMAEYPAGTKMLRPLALVGAWHENDLREGSIQMKCIHNEELFKPNASCIYENPEFTRREALGDPRSMPPCEVQGQQPLFV